MEKRIFPIIDLNLDLKGLKQYLGLSGTALSWFQSYLSNRKQFVTIRVLQFQPGPRSTKVFPEALFLKDNECLEGWRFSL